MMQPYQPADALKTVAQDDPWAHDPATLLHHLPPTVNPARVVEVGERPYPDLVQSGLDLSTRLDNIVNPSDWFGDPADVIITYGTIQAHEVMHDLQPGGILLQYDPGQDAIEPGNDSVTIYDPRPPGLLLHKRMRSPLQDASRDTRQAVVDTYTQDKHNRNYVLLHHLAFLHGRPGMRILEYGTAQGNSATLFASAARPWNGDVVTVDDWRDRRAGQQDALDQLSTYNLENVTLANSEATQHVNNLLASEGFHHQFDVIFHDAHGGDVVDRMRKTTQLLRPGGLMLLHDTNTVEADTAPAFNHTPEARAFHYQATMQGEGIGIYTHRGDEA